MPAIPALRGESTHGLVSDPVTPAAKDISALTTPAAEMYAPPARCDLPGFLGPMIAANMAQYDEHRKTCTAFIQAPS